jgi:peroxiredoxin
MYKKSFLLLIITIITGTVGFSQTTEIKSPLSDSLKGLRIETKQDSLLPSMKLDGSVPIYDENGKNISGMDVITAMQSGNGIPVRYINEKKEVKAYVLRPTTEEEKKKIKEKFKPVSAQKNGMVGKPAYPFELKDMNDKTYSLKDLKGKIVVLNFWFVECMPCRKEMPELNNLVKKYEDKGVVFLGIANSEKSKILKLLEKIDFKYTIIPKEALNKVLEDYNINAYPTHIVIDKDSNMKYYTEGLNDKTIESLMKAIDTLISL